VFDFIVFIGWIDKKYKNTLEKETILYQLHYKTKFHRIILGGFWKILGLIENLKF
jgi:hypothetical protein